MISNQNHLYRSYLNSVDFLGSPAKSRMILENSVANGTSHSKIVGSTVLYLCSSLAAAGGVGEGRLYSHIFDFDNICITSTSLVGVCSILCVFSILNDLVLHDLLVYEQFKMTIDEMI